MYAPPIEYSIPMRWAPNMRSVTGRHDIAPRAEPRRRRRRDRTSIGVSRGIHDICHVAFTPISFVTYGTLTPEFGYSAMVPILGEFSLNVSQND